MTEKIKLWVENLSTIGFIPLIATMSTGFSKRQFIALYIAAGLYVLDFFVNQRWKNLQWDKRNWTFVSFIFFFFVINIFAFADKHTNRQWGDIAETYLPMLIYGAIGLVGIFGKIRIKHIAWTMSLVSLYIIVYSNYVWRELYAEQYPGEEIEFWRQFEIYYYYRTQEFGAHMIINVYRNIAVIMGLYSLHNEKMNRLEKILTTTLIVLLCLAIAASDGRIGLITLIVILFSFLLRYATQKIGKKLTIIAMTVLAVFVGVIVLNKDKFQDSTNIKHNPRYDLWHVACKTIAEKPIFGHGVFSYKEDYSKNAIQNEGIQKNYMEEFYVTYPDHDITHIHPHNEFLKTGMQIGLVGLFLFILNFALPFFTRWGENQIFINLFVFCFSLQMLFDVFHTGFQPRLYCLVYLMLFSAIKQVYMRK